MGFGAMGIITMPIKYVGDTEDIASGKMDIKTVTTKK
jgi:hypothetical protein